MAGDDLHENLLADFERRPEIVSAECHAGNVDLQWADGLWSTAQCPRCLQTKILAAVDTFIPPRFREPVELPQSVAEWVARGMEAEGLYLAGPVGTGKTHAAWTATRSWCLVAGVVPHHGHVSPHTGRNATPSVIFARMTDLLDDFRPGDDAVRRVRACQNARLLVVDDLGAEKASEWTQERLYSVIDHRYANCMPLIVTGNLPPAKLAEQTGDRVASRLAEMCTVVPITGTDRRRAA